MGRHFAKGLAASSKQRVAMLIVLEMVGCQQWSFITSTSRRDNLVFSSIPPWHFSISLAFPRQPVHARVETHPTNFPWTQICRIARDSGPLK